MNPADFLHDTATRRLLERAGRAAGMPLSLHPYDPELGEGLRICGSGACQACSFIAGVPGGRQACRDSRAMPSVQCLRQKRPIPFVCHLGFACLSIPVTFPGLTCVISLGPWNPAEAPRSLEFDACQGLETLDGNRYATFPTRLDDIRVTVNAAPLALAEWLIADLQALWEAFVAGHTQNLLTTQEVDSDSLQANAPRSSEATALRSIQRPGLTALEQYPGKAIATALMAGDSAQARLHFEGAMAPLRQPVSTIQEPGAAHLRCAAIVASTLEHLARIGHIRPAADRFTAWLDEQAETASAEALIRSALAFLRKQLPTTKAATKAATPASPKAPSLAESPTDTTLQISKSAQSPQARKLEKNLKAIFRARKLQNEITLQDVATELGETPSAISHRMKKLLGMHFSEYLGRIRVEEAKRLLRQTRLSATAIAKRVGVADQSHFSKLFKKYTGMTPLNYRKSIQRPS